VSKQYVQRRLEEIREENKRNPRIGRTLAMPEDPTDLFKMASRRRRAITADASTAERLALMDIEEKIRSVRVIDRKAMPAVAPRGDDWAGPDFKPLTLDEARALPVLDRSAIRAGVYFLFLANDLMYIGSSINVWQRVLTHDLYKTAIFDTARFLAVPWPWNIAVEALHIRALAPIENANWQA
jgi:hypothetical protein